jgi:hypothetical protein
LCAKQKEKKPTDFGLSTPLGLNLKWGKLVAGTALALVSSSSAAAAIPAPKPALALTSLDTDT